MKSLRFMLYNGIMRCFTTDVLPLTIHRMTSVVCTKADGNQCPICDEAERIRKELDIKEKA